MNIKLSEELIKAIDDCGLQVIKIRARQLNYPNDSKYHNVIKALKEQLYRLTPNPRIATLRVMLGYAYKELHEHTDEIWDLFSKLKRL